MYNGSSPLFEAQDYPALRRIKPLPKRRRTSSEQAFHDPADAAGLGAQQPGLYHAVGDELTQEEILKNTSAGRAFLSTLDSFYNAAAAAAAADDDEQGEGDYIDHLQQPNNTKKRKVPTAPHQQHNPSDSPQDDDPQGDRGAGQKLESEDGEPAAAAAMGAGSGARRKVKASAVTVAGLQHKEMLKTRKRQLSSVLGATAPADDLALDQALAARYAVPGAAFSTPRPAEYVSSRPRRPRRKKPLLLLPAPPAEQTVAMVEGDFEFTSQSASSDRSLALREEVSVLYQRFEAELARQAAKAAEAAKQSALALAESPKRAVQRSRGAPAPPAVDPAATATKGRQTKKKKRSALANASNPHHLRNYVPSRLPHSGQPPQNTQALNAANFLGPPPLRFLSAEVPPKRRKKSASPPPAGPLAAQLTNPADEWICPFCEYNLFYGDDAAYKRAVKSRKKILQRRRRARERAAAAASGVAPVAAAPPPADKPVTGETHVAGETAANDAPAVKNLAKRDRDKGGSGPAAAV
ncbi:hypothetical protein AURDEDRAFT_114525 [Auricularia subglabra TFB-10046 SS5]|nr:hypothetical protein AURDEDRAFT_114525 [Auricularia subglabra TFB-10046 SS5]